jgi:hypothetical protein
MVYAWGPAECKKERMPYPLGSQLAIFVQIPNCGANIDRRTGMVVFERYGSLVVTYEVFGEDEVFVDPAKASSLP